MNDYKTVVCPACGGTGETVTWHRGPITGKKVGLKNLCFLCWGRKEVKLTDLDLERIEKMREENNDAD